MRESSSPETTIIIHIPAAGFRIIGCHRGTAVVLKPAKGNKTKKRMKHDIFAAFYEKANSRKPAYRCPLGVFSAPTLDYFKENGWKEDKNATPGYLDYCKVVDEDELQQWAQEGFRSEIMDVYFCSGKEFGKIVLQAEELDVLDDEGLLPVRGLPINNSFVKFSGTEALSPVTFIDGDPYEMNENTRHFSIPLKKLKDYFNVLTMMEVMERMEVFGSGGPWSYDELKDYFESGIDDAVDLATRAFFGSRDLDGNPEILHALYVGMQGRNKNEMIVGFLHDVVEDTDATLEKLAAWGFSEDVISAIDLLTHRKDVPYMDYIRDIVRSENITAIWVKINDLQHNIARGVAGNHTKHVAKHRAALEVIREGIKSLNEEFQKNS